MAWNLYKTGRAKEATWYGKAPKQEEMEAALEEIALTAGAGKPCLQQV